MKTESTAPARRAFLADCESLEARRVLSNRTFVVAIYEDVLLRTPSRAEVQPLVNALNRGKLSRNAVAWGIWGSAEHRGIQVDGLYEQVLDRPADAAGRLVHVNALLNGRDITDVKQDFLTSPEYLGKHQSNPSFVTGLYQDVLNRAPDAPGEAVNLNLLDGGLSRPSLANEFLWSDEGVLFSVDVLYANLFHRLADADGLENFGSVVQGGFATLDDVAVALITSGEFEQIHAQIPV